MRYNIVFSLIIINLLFNLITSKFSNLKMLNIKANEKKKGLINPFFFYNFILNRLVILLVLLMQKNQRLLTIRSYTN